MDQLVQKFKKQVEYHYLLSRQRCLESKQNTFDDLHFSQQLYKILGDTFSPHTLYHYAATINDMTWFEVNSHIIESEEFSDDRKILLMTEDSDYAEEKFITWFQYCDLGKDKLTSMIFKFMDDECQEWDVNSAARGVIDNLLIATWHYRDCLMKD